MLITRKIGLDHPFLEKKSGLQIDTSKGIERSQICIYANLLKISFNGIAKTYICVNTISAEQKLFTNF